MLIERRAGRRLLEGVGDRPLLLHALQTHGQRLVLLEGQPQSLAGDAPARSSAPASDCGIVVGRIILFLIRLRRSRSSMSNGTQRMTFSRPASASTFETE